METMENMETTNTVKRKSLYYGDGTTVNKKQTLSIYDSLFNYFNETTEDEENYINEVSNYFNMLNDAPVTCANLPDVKKTIMRLKSYRKDNKYMLREKKMKI
jgi:hypothetical protein